jgi:putative transposase
MEKLAVNPVYTSQECSSCGTVVKKSRFTRTHVCRCGCKLDRDYNAAINILQKGIGTVGHTGTYGLNPLNASGELISTLVGEIPPEQVAS